MSDSEDSDTSHDQTTTNDLDFESSDVKTIISEMVQYVITNSQKKFPIKKQCK